MLSCCRPRKDATGEREPLLAASESETELQRKVKQKFRQYEILRALFAGYMPTTEQAAALLRLVLVSDVLNPDNPMLSPRGGRIAKDCRAWTRIFIALLREKNSGDQLQEIISQFMHSNVTINTAQVASAASKSKARADTIAAYESVRTVGKLLMTNSDFRRLVGDITTIGRSIFSDTTASLSDAINRVAEEVEPSESQKDSVRTTNGNNKHAPTSDELMQDGEQVMETAKEGLEDTGRAAKKSAETNVSTEAQDSLFYQMKKTVEDLRLRPDYDNSVSTISGLVQRYAGIYMQTVGSTVEGASDALDIDPELHDAMKNLWELARSFGSQSEWESLEGKFQQLMQGAKRSTGVNDTLDHIGQSIYSLFTDPSFWDSGEDTVKTLKEKVKETEGDLPQQEFKDFIYQLKKTLISVTQDAAVAKLITATKKIALGICEAYRNEGIRLMADALNIFLPLLIRAIQYIPIPRLEVSVPQMDLLLENVVVEPGHTVHNSSFLPYQVLVTTISNMELRKTHSKEAVSGMKNVVNVTLNGLCFSTNDFGYWIKAHRPPFPSIFDEGIASFCLDQRGIDVSCEFEVGRERLEQILSLRAVRVHIHKLDYSIAKSRWSCILWALKPFLKHMIRRSLEKMIAEKIVGYARAANRELLFVRERLRAARIADPDDFLTFIRAVMARLSGKADPDIFTRLGFDAQRGGIFDGVYAPGSLAKAWHEEQERADELIERSSQDSLNQRPTWRNSIFDVPARGH
ncbi:Malic enzyme, NAD binding domain family protein [Trichophyton interdigitale]|uniref:Bactericidal permeability-increasing protein, alpha/beta domain n=1 Tax=Trichophyton interdigitale TaxID=101480 RepID=A0A9P4YJP9_9EURO|nr:Bactericidal permeability-increasing protein, alpha/beta domain [Trichophyton interdigitale]KAF3900146.1 Bactericidal permeability-increasing protein, alpha/beta domain [Trichophyton interdigitale]KAG8211186.1 Malic enzyme, NAD binding domain family protein [Trichophyton interdigitale]